MRKVYKKLSQEQKDKGIIFTSTLSKCRTEQINDLTHEVKKDDEDISEHISRLKDDSFFNGSPWNYNIIRTV